MENRRQIDIKSPKVGRPTIYSQNYCQEVINLGRQGKSYEQIASILNVGLRTLFSWRDAHVEFRHALRDAKDFEMAFWEELAQSYLIEHKNAPRLNTGLWSRSMAARFPAKYSERMKKEFSPFHEDTPIRGFKLIFEEPNKNSS